MLKKLMSFLLVGLVLVPTLAFAETKEYKTLNLAQVIEEENKQAEQNNGEKIESKLGNYKEADNKVNVYLFRGLGCGYCRGFITFLNDNIDELGKYFNLVSYEVWNDKDNSTLLRKVGNFTEVPAQGVPYIIVGDRVFDGFTEAAYGEDFKEALKAEYEKKDRYDVFKEMEKAEQEKNKPAGAETTKVILWDGLFSLVTIAAVGSMIYYNNKNMTKLIESKVKVKNYEKEEKRQEVKEEKAKTKKTKKK